MKRLIVCAMILGAILLGGQADALELTKKTDYNRKNSIGGRIGAYVNTSDETPADDIDFSLDFSSSSIMIEFFYAHRLFKPVDLEMSMGVFKRGELQYNGDEGLIDEAVLIYPFWLSARLYPFYGLNSKLRFYLQPGVGLIYGRRTIIDLNYYDYSTGEYLTSTENRTKLTFLAGAGVDFQVHSKIALTASFKYLPADFGKALAGVNDYSGWTLTFGIGYIWNN